MKWGDFIRDYLIFTRKERIGIVVVVGLILFLLFLPDILKRSIATEPAQIDTAWMAALRKLEITKVDSSNEDRQKDHYEDSYVYQYDKKKSNYSESNKGELFYFDPNTTSNADWKRLGLRDKTIQTIQNYLNKGGRFYKPEDLQKIYGLYENEYEKLLPFVKIEPTTTISTEQLVSKAKEEIQPIKTYATKYSIIEINTADSTAFISLPGIGSKLAARIVNFRDKLGGFYSIDQIEETYGLPDSTFQKIKQYLKLDNASLRKININTATVDELKAHPYIKFNLANPIVSYRIEHGPFLKIEEIKNVMAVTDEIYKKIAPYLTL